MRPTARASRAIIPLPHAVLLVLAILALAACDDATAPPDDRVVEGVDLDVLFAPATPAEVAAVLAEWESRDPTATDVRTEETLTRTVAGSPATLRVVSAVTDGNRHYGAVQVVDGAAAGSLPILLVAHGGDSGTSAFEIDLLSSTVGALAAEFVVVAPAFRSETFTAGTAYVSEGDPSPWDRDVDDALAFIQAAAAVTPAADPTRVAAVGFSRGGGVALLAAIRDAGIAQVVEYFGPTDMFTPWVETLVEGALRGSLVNLPGLADLDAQVIQPLRRGEITMAHARLEMVRRSSVLFADRLPPTQLHHGALDPIVPVSQGESLIAAMEALGRTAPDFESYLYPAGTHNPLSLPGAIDRTVDALRRLLPEAILAAR